MKASDRTASGSNGFMTLKVELPPTGIVRTISVPECMTLEDLHEAIQAVMGWRHEHLWHFVTGGRDGIIYEVLHEDDFAAFGRRLRMDAAKTVLRKVLKNLKTGEVWVRVGKNKWQCRNCGAIVTGKTAPETCPVCAHPRAYFQLEADNY